MSRLLCCLRARTELMGAPLSQPQEGAGGVDSESPPTMHDLIRERKKKAGSAALGTLRRRIASAARRPRTDPGCEHARFIRSVVRDWSLAEVFLLHEELEALAELRDVVTRAELAREPAPVLQADMAHVGRSSYCDVELVGSGWSLLAHKAMLSARSAWLRDLLRACPSGVSRLPLSSCGLAGNRDLCVAFLKQLYLGSYEPELRENKWDQCSSSENDLDIISIENSNKGGCVEWCRVAAACRALGVSLSLSDYLADLRSLTQGDYADCILRWNETDRDLPCHRFILCARSRFFRSCISRLQRAPPCPVCVDEAVLPRRFAPALLHAAYTDVVDLNLIERPSSSPSSSNGSTNSMSWPGVGRGGHRAATSAVLEDAFQLYEIARFLEMPIVIQGCEDAIVEAFTPATIPAILRWSCQPHASPYIHRQAQRYLRDEFVTIMSSPHCGGVPLRALHTALSSPFLQCSELQALRALLRWAHENTHKPPEATGTLRRGARRRELCVSSVRHACADLLPLIRAEHVPANNELVQQAVRRGIMPAPPPVPEGTSTADLWLAKPPRCFQPYLDEIKALLEGQSVPEADLARLRRAKRLHRIPDTLYMVSEEQQQLPNTGRLPRSSSLVLGGSALLGRARELLSRPSPPADANRRQQYIRQIALRAVREMSLPDSVADMILVDIREMLQERNGEAGAASLPLEREWDRDEGSRSSTCRRDLPSQASETSQHRSWSPAGAIIPPRLPPEGLSSRVPDVAMSLPNANTHLLTVRDYWHPPPSRNDYGCGVLQLDLGDGATHAPPHGSRAQRANAIGNRLRDHSQPPATSHRDDDELRAAIELSVMRAYSSQQWRPSSPQCPQEGSYNRPSRHYRRRIELDEASAAPEPRIELGAIHHSLSRGSSSRAHALSLREYRGDGYRSGGASPSRYS